MVNQATSQRAARVDYYRWLVLTVLCIVYVCNFLDRQIMAILSEPIKRELALSDTQMGLLTGSMFALFYAVFGVPVGWLADRTHRVRVLAVSCALWSAFSAACGVAGNFLQLALARMGVGIGEAGGAPPSYSIISDYFPPRQRVVALALFSLGVPLGSALGSALGATVAHAYGWRAAFLGIGAIGVGFAILVVLTVREPLRGQMDDDQPRRLQANAVESNVAAVLSFFFASCVLRRTASAGGLAAFAYYGMLNWSVPLLLREKGMIMSEVAVYYSLMLAVSMGMGMCLSGWIVARLARIRRDAYANVPALALLLAVPFFVGFLCSPGWRWSLAWLAAPSLLGIMFLAPALAIVQNETPPALRTTAGAVLLLIINLVGLGGGPLFVGIVSDALAGLFDNSLSLALACLVPFWLLAAGAHLLAGRALSRAGRPTCAPPDPVRSPAMVP